MLQLQVLLTKEESIRSRQGKESDYSSVILYHGYKV